MRGRWRNYLPATNYTMINQDPLYCIICGFERSGTTLVAELLRQHPKIDGRFECGFLLAENPAHFLVFENYVNNLKFWGITKENIVHICQAETWAEAYRRLLERSNILNKSVWLYDKTPRYMLYLNKVMAKVEVPCIATVRDPRAVYWSHQKRIETDLKGFCDFYLGYGRAWKDALERYPDRLLLVRHEQFCTEPECESRRIYDFLGLEFRPEYILLAESTNPYVNRGGIAAETIHEYRGNITAEAEDYILEQTAEFACWHWE